MMGTVRERAEDEAINVFARNLHDLLMAAPAGLRATMGLDPGLRTGVKVAVVDGTGKLVATDTIYPHTGQAAKAAVVVAALCEKYKVPMMITSLGAREELNQAAHRWGGIVFHDVINQTFAHKAIEKGADGLILVAAGAGGHAGTISPFAFVAETRSWFDGPIALSGAIANGRAIRAARVLGADFAYIGSAFIATKEANAVEGYKQMITSSGADDIVYSNLFTGVHGNYLKPSIVAAGLDPDNLPTSDPSKMSFGTDASGERAKPKAWKEIWGSGQGIGAIKDVLPAAELIARFKKEYDEAIDPPL
ncbi:MAG: nitronate monooxygenase [Bradyrhizobium sp.]|nr:nitronate monooxygenase [Bradyrhizobium sp.]